MREREREGGERERERDRDRDRQRQTDRLGLKIQLTYLLTLVSPNLATARVSVSFTHKDTRPHVRTL